MALDGKCRIHRFQCNITNELGTNTSPCMFVRTHYTYWNYEYTHYASS